MLRTLIAIAAALSLAPGCARHRQASRSNASAPSSTLSADPAPDNTFLQFAAMEARGVIALSESAAIHGSPQVRELARKISTDQSAALSRITREAEKRKVVLPSEADSKHLAQAERLGALNGAEFDREYLAAMVADHEFLLSTFQERTRVASARAVRSFASDSVPVLQSNLDASRRLTGQDLTDSR